MDGVDVISLLNLLKEKKVEIHFPKELEIDEAQLKGLEEACIQESKGLYIFYVGTKKTPLYNPSVTFTYDESGNLIEIRIYGKDKEGNHLGFIKKLSYDENGNLVQISKWVIT